MKKNTYLTLNILGMFLIIFPTMIMGESFKLIIGILAGIGISMSAVSTFKLFKS